MELSTIPVSGAIQLTAPPAIKAASADPASVSLPQPSPQVQFSAANTATARPASSAGVSQQETAAQENAFVYILGNTASATFKDATGAYITRSVDESTGVVTYSPEPQYVKPSSASVSIVA